MTHLFLLLMDVLTEDARKDVPRSMMFADDIVLVCGDDEIDMTEYLGVGLAHLAGVRC